MTAYVVIRIKADDPSLLKDYQTVAPSIIEKYNGKFLVRGGEVVTLEGPEEPRRIVIIEFPSLEDANKFYHSDEYMSAIELRKSVAIAEIIAVAGVEQPSKMVL